MDDYLIEVYAGILEQHQAVTFEHKEQIYRIWANDAGWYLQVLGESDESIWSQDGRHVVHDNPFVEVDGGQCTGSARDAVEFML